MMLSSYTISTFSILPVLPIKHTGTCVDIHTHFKTTNSTNSWVSAPPVCGAMHFGITGFRLKLMAGPEQSRIIKTQKESQKEKRRDKTSEEREKAKETEG